jgi:elongation factor Ts
MQFLSSQRLFCGTSLLVNSRIAILKNFKTFSSSVIVPASLVKQLREQTGAGFVDCQKALQAENGDLSRAVDFLRKKGLAAAAKKSTRIAAQGLISVTLNEKATSGSIIEINSETDFVARNEHFQDLARKISLTALSHSEVSNKKLSTGGSDVVKKVSLSARFTEAINEATALSSLKLTTSTADVTVNTAVTELIAKVGENIVLRRVHSLHAKEGGLICAYIHNATSAGLGSIGVLVSLAPKVGKGSSTSTPSLSSSSSSWTALNDLGKKVAMHIAAAKPQYLSQSDVPEADVEREREVLKSQALASGKEAKNIDKMITGRLNKFFADICLLDQAFILSEDGIKVGKLVEDISTKAGYAVRIDAYSVFAVGEVQPQPTTAASNSTQTSL